MWCKLEVKTPSEYTYSLFWGAELSRLLGEKIPVAIVGLEPGTPGSVVQCFNHLAPKHYRIASDQLCHVLSRGQRKPHREETAFAPLSRLHPPCVLRLPLPLPVADLFVSSELLEH